MTTIDRIAHPVMGPARVVAAYVEEARAECLRYLRNPGFLLPTLLFPSVFYLMFGVFLGVFTWALGRSALVPIKDPRIAESVKFENF